MANLDNKGKFFVMSFTDSELFAGISTKSGLPTKVLVALTVLKLARNANSDGLINWLRQPGQIRNALKSL